LSTRRAKRALRASSTTVRATTTDVGHNRILDTVRSTKGPRGLPATDDALRAFEPTELFETLFAASVLAQGGAYPVAYAGCALFALDPPCGLTVNEAVGRLRSEWDISLEEVVFYLAKQFGTAAVTEAAKQLQSSSLAHEEAVRLRTGRYWVDVYQSKASSA